MIGFDREVFRCSFNQRPFRVQHSLSGHPLFELERLIALARELPHDRIEYNAGDVPITQDASLTPQNGLSVTETIRRIEACRSWMVLKNVELDREYRALALACLEPVRGLCPDLRALETFVFVSSPDAVTPFHIDPECNFLLQVRGTKTIRIFPPHDRTVVSEEELERFFAGGTRNLLRFTAETAAKATRFELSAGQGVHVPVTAPHFVQNGPDVSVSFSVTFRTGASDRREIAYRLNHRLRRFGLRPRPVGQSKVIDELKYTAFDLARRATRAVSAIKRPAERELSTIEGDAP